MIIAPPEELVYRECSPELDHAYIFKTWLCTYRHSPMVRKVPNDTYYDAHRAIIDRLLKKSVTLIAANPEDESHIYGFICYQEPNILHFAAVKRLYWRFGLGRAMVKKADLKRQIYCSHWAEMMDIWQTGHEMVYSPYLQHEE